MTNCERFFPSRLMMLRSYLFFFFFLGALLGWSLSALGLDYTGLSIYDGVVGKTICLSIFLSV